MSVKKLKDLVDRHPSNIAEGLSDDTLGDIAHTCMKGYNDDEASREEYVSRVDEGIKLATQVVEHKNSPWPGAANVKYPLVTEGALRFSAEAYPALVDSHQPVKAKVIGEDPTGEKTESASRVSKHMSYQVLEKMDEWEADMDELLILVSIIGTMFKKTYWNEEKNRPQSDTISPKDLVINYYTRRLQDSPRITHKLYFSQNEVYEKQKGGMWLDEDLGEPETPKDRTDTKYSRTGEQPPSANEDTPHTILEMHTWYDLDEDGYKEPWIITIDETSEKVLRVMPRFDPINTEESIIANANNEIIRIVPDEYFTKFSFVPNPERSVYDLGLYHLAGPLNEAANTIINQLIDAGTMSNLQSGFISKGLRIRGGEKRFKPGEWKPVNATMDDLKKGIFPLPVREPSSVLFNLLGSVVDAGQRLTSTTDTLAGDSGQHNQKANAALANIELGMKVFNGIYKRLHRGLKQEFKKIFRVNSEYLTGREYFTILDAEVANQPQQVLETDYNPESMDVIPTSDPNVVTEQQKLQKAQALFELSQQGLVNPQVATKRMLEAQDQPGIEELMDIPSPQPSFEQQIQQKELQIKEYQAQVEAKAKASEQRINALKAEADAYLKLAQADNENTQSNLDKYRMIIEMIRDEGNEQLEREKMQNDREVAEKKEKPSGNEQ
jgi:chaperonin GroES